MRISSIAALLDCGTQWNLTLWSDDPGGTQWNLALWFDGLDHVLPPGSVSLLSGLDLDCMNLRLLDSQIVGFMDCWTLGLLWCWNMGLLNSWIAGLLDSLIPRLLDAELSDCWTL